MLSRKCAEQLRRQCDIEEWDNAETQHAAELLRFATQLIEEVFQLTKEPAGMLLKNQPARGKQNAFPATLKERNAKGGLEVAHLLGDAGL